MKITLHLVVSLILIVGLSALVFSLYGVREEKADLIGELERRSIILGESLQESVVTLIGSGSIQRLTRFVEKFGNRERLRGIAVYDRNGNIIAATSELRARIDKIYPHIVDSITEKKPKGEFMNFDGKKLYIYILPLRREEEFIGTIALFQDASYIDVRLLSIWKYNFIRFLLLSVLIMVVTVFVIRWSITGPIAQIAEWIRELRMGKRSIMEPENLRGNVLSPLISEVTHLAKSLSMARARAEEEAMLRLQVETLWTASRLKEYMKAQLGDKKLYLISNKEPYMHVRDGRTIRCITPAGGLVTALDPVMRVCDGVWIAHGSGDADREMVDGDDKIRVPPGEESYTLKRIWLTKEEENGYYYGFSNEGLWPLCHITHTRPIFRLEDWIQYQKVNEKFADAVLKEIANEQSPIVLIQDYHFALLPFLIKKRRPDARIALFWHIPWPNPESFGICPWREEILIGMLGADLIGFHIQFFCNNFMDTIDRFLESRIDWEHFLIERGGHSTLIRPFPISVSFEDLSRDMGTFSDIKEFREILLKEMNVRSKYIGVGVDRIDYTKGIPERFRTIERFFEKYPEYIGNFTFIELGAPSRIHIRRYRELITEVEEMVDRINWRFQSKVWKPIIFLKGHHSHNEIYKFYRIADLCMVTSLHDGMNLVAKEFVATRVDEDGVLILSQFTGAARELRDALIVNPYNIEEMADAIKIALTMEVEERRERMRRMRMVLREHNIYRWAGKLIETLVRLRIS